MQRQAEHRTQKPPKVKRISPGKTHRKANRVGVPVVSSVAIENKSQTIQQASGLCSFQGFKRLPVKLCRVHPAQTKGFDGISQTARLFLQSKAKDTIVRMEANLDPRRVWPTVGVQD